MADLTLKLEREVKPTEIGYLIFGTGMFGWAPWWQGADIIHHIGNDKWEVVTDPFESTVFGDAVRITFDDPNQPEGSGKTKTMHLTLQQVVDAVPKAWKHLPAETVRDMTEDLGLADAEGADITMQYAVFGEVVYG